MRKSKTRRIIHKTVALILTAAMLVTGASGYPEGVLRHKLQQVMG